jgi:hypothetical protein
MKKGILLIAVLAMVAFLFAAVAWDCVRLADDARHRVAMADEEMQKHEQRFVKLLTESARQSPEVQADLAAYKAATTPQTRQAAYEKLATSFRQTMADGVDPTNPLDRKFMDDIAGAINRREIAQEQYNTELAAYQSYLNSKRGAIAQWFSSSARTATISGD